MTKVKINDLFFSFFGFSCSINMYNRSYVKSLFFVTIYVNYFVQIVSFNVSAVCVCLFLVFFIFTFF